MISFLRSSGILIGCVLTLLPATAQQARPNVLFLFADDQRADTIAALGNPVIQTPNLDRLARSGVAFDRAYMQGAFNGATCTPSRAMLLTGRNLFRVNENLAKEGRTEDTWPAAFGRAGYATFLSGKWHNSPSVIPHAFGTARSVFLGGMGNPMELPLCDWVDGKQGPPRKVSKHSVEVFSDEVIRFLNERKSGPFFAYVAFDAPHDPHVVPPDFGISYDPADIPIPANFLPQHPWDNGEMSIRDELLLPWPRTPERVKSYLAEYYRYVSYLDRQIGRVLDALAASPHAADTIVVFSADSGVACGSHGLVGKQNCYEHSMRVPLIVSGPGIAAGKRSGALCYLFDVLPTLGRICGVSPPQDVDGIDLGATLADPSRPGRGSVILAYQNVQRAASDGRWKLIRYPKVDRTQLFDLQIDPLETKNLAGQPAHAAKVAELSALLEREMRRSGDSCALTVANPSRSEWTPPVKKRKPHP